MEKITSANYPGNAGKTERIPTGPTQVDPRVSKVLSILLERSITTGRLLDEIKRHIYYSKDCDVVTIEMRCEETHDFNVDYPAAGFSLTPEQFRILHTSLGLLTEAGELAEVVLANLRDGEPLDKVNIMEEIGDGYWYSAIPMNMWGWSMDQVLQANIDKLKKRYPQGWTQEDALNRDLPGERKTLEQHGPSPAPGA